jgi:hypothetical protein
MARLAGCFSTTCRAPVHAAACGGCRRSGPGIWLDVADLSDHFPLMD